MTSREWVTVVNPTGRPAKWADDLRHVLVELDPYSGYGKTACGKAFTGTSNHKLDEDITESLERDGIPPNLCPKCDRLVPA